MPQQRQQKTKGQNIDRKSAVTQQTTTRSSPRTTTRKATYYPTNIVNKHFVDSVPILEITVRFDEDEYDIWRRQDTNEVNLYYLLRVKYPKDEDEEKWKQELEKLKKEVVKIKVIENGWFEGVWVPLETAKEIASEYGIYEYVAALLESENSWFNNNTKKYARPKNGRDSTRRSNTNIVHKRKTSDEESNIPIASSSKSTANLTDEDDNNTNKRRSLRIKLKSEAKIQSSIESQESSLSSTVVRGESSNRSKSKSNDDDDDESADGLEEENREIATTTVVNGDGNIREEIKELKRKLDVGDDNQPISKRKVVWAAGVGVGATIGAGVAALTLNGGIASTILNYFS